MAESAGETQKRLVAEEITTRTTTHTISIEREITRNPNGTSNDDCNFDLDTSLNLKTKRDEENVKIAALNRRFAVVVERNSQLEKEVALLNEKVKVAERTRVETIREVTRTQEDETEALRSQLATEKKLRKQTENELNNVKGELEKALKLRNNVLAKIESIKKELEEMKCKISQEQQKNISFQEEYTVTFKHNN